MDENHDRLPPGPPNMFITTPSLPRGCAVIWIGFLVVLAVVISVSLIVDVYYNGW